MKRIKIIFKFIEYSINLICNSLFVVFFSNNSRENGILNKNGLFFNNCFNFKIIL